MAAKSSKSNSLDVKSDAKAVKTDEKVTESDKKVTKKEKKTLIEHDIDYRNAMAREKLRRLILQNDHQQFDLDKKNESVCYRAIAMSEFEKAIASIYAQIQNAEEQLAHLLRLDQTQVDVLHDYMENILNALSEINVELSATSDFDAANYRSGTALKTKLLSTN